MMDRAYIKRALIEFSEPGECSCQAWDDYDPETMGTVHHPGCKFFDPDEVREDEECE